MSIDVCVIGAGIVGVTTALELRSRGYEVLLVDRLAPGMATSFGNAGVLTQSAVDNVNNPLLLKSLPRMVMRQSASVSYDLGYAFTKIGWLIQFFRFSTARYALPTAHLLQDLQAISMGKHRMLIRKSGAQDLFRETGWLKVFRTARGFGTSRHERSLMDSLNVSYSILNGDEVVAYEPALRPVYNAGLLMHQTCSIVDPHALTRSYFGLFERQHGQYQQADVTGLRQSGKQWTVLVRDADSIQAKQVVIAGGPWSPDLCAMLGYRIPMAWERGYHLHVASPAETLRRPIHDVERGFVMAPQGSKTRITSGVDFAHRDAAPNFAQVRRAVVEAQSVAGFGEILDREPWVGSRPTLPDSFPMIGGATRHDGIWFNFGHQHIGMSTSTGSAEILADLMDGDLSPDIDHKAFSPDRFRI